MRCEFCLDYFNRNTDIVSYDKVSKIKIFLQELSQYYKALLSQNSNLSQLNSYGEIINAQKNINRGIKYIDEKLAVINNGLINALNLINNMATIGNDADNVDNTNKIQSYFYDCSSKEEVIKRYKQLVKVFHPDSNCGNEEIFKNIQNEFEQLIAHYSS